MEQHDSLWLFFYHSINVYLGYDVETLRTRSWYSLLHPEDLSHASAQHCRLREYAQHDSCHPRHP